MGEGTAKQAVRILASLAIATAAAAHDFWILPSDFRPAAGAPISVNLRVGEHFVGEAVVPKPDRILRFSATYPDGRVEPVAGLDGDVYTGSLRLGGSGVFVIGYRNRPSRIELPPEKFEAYLHAEGLDAVLEARERKGDRAKAGREIYSRCAKSLIRAGPVTPADAQAGDRRLGFPLELTAEEDPTRLAVGSDLRMSLAYLDRPLAHALVGCMEETHAADEERVRTDDQGRVRFRIRTPGVHLVRVVHMVPAPADSGADWESFWASTTFEIDARGRR